MCRHLKVVSNSEKFCLLGLKTKLTPPLSSMSSKKSEFIIRLLQQQFLGFLPFYSMFKNTIFVCFALELNNATKTFFTKEYLKRKQSFQKSSSAKWPLPNCRKAFHLFGGKETNVKNEREKEREKVW